ncbi:MAG: orotate phosphoribosyltransferase [Prolixibacteraceae bacterium]|jgi:orotate phosphoribosyltransferase|nr:orotate phosphoribosyltransferase [Prolixibacteraceae bacterium]MBT6007050.1 orotate phosphoribosyltransferase [Prolixibacteraceae bacterium]MBT6766585.1 orotate phosphoribosyltransferase [Prolixibacteraceae bacterium]MBT6998322.1 orotate phosphoribosyltransferase [Prolixibacteraceae bacterium]MBT7396432.1 orotate phosphoribosyltransferase [Prolixibacteraceae bacterium]
MESTQIEVIKQLLQINTLKIQPSNPFTWASGWKSPIYCDNRKILSYPKTRAFICNKFVEVIKEKYPDAEVIAGVATGAIAHGVLVAEKLGLPFIYVRSKPKGHGLENLIEGDLKPGQKVVVIEDLISTGVSSLNAAEAISNFGGQVSGMVAIFTYNFPLAKENFQKANVELSTLSRYQVLIDTALEMNEITKDQVNSLMKWREDPANWGK